MPYCVSPEGTAECAACLTRAYGHNFSRPFGTWSIRTLLPTLKRWAIVARSLRDSRRVSNWIQPRTSNTNGPQVSLQRGYSFVTHPCAAGNHLWLDHLRPGLYV